MRRLALKRKEPRSTRRRIVEMLFGVSATAALLLTVADHWFGLRDRVAALRGHSVSGHPDDRAVEAIKIRIAGLLKPREGSFGIGGDPAARQVDAALLYGQLALIEEGRDRPQAAASYMARGVSLLKATGHPDPTEAHIRTVLADQGGRRR
jgi:hypothetical protein